MDMLCQRDDLIVFISTQRNKELTSKGFLRDLARNLQQLRKESSYNPTDTLSTAFIANLSDGRNLFPFSIEGGIEVSCKSELYCINKRCN